MGIERTVDGKPRLMIRPIQLDIWEISPDAWEQRLDDRSAAHRRGPLVREGDRPCERNHRRHGARAPGIFFFVTIEGTPGLFILVCRSWRPSTSRVTTNILKLRQSGERRGRRTDTTLARNRKATPSPCRTHDSGDV